MVSHLTTHKKIQEQSTISLIRCMQFLFGIKEYNIVNCYKHQPRGAYKELIRRLINPFYLPVLILTSLLLILTSKENLKYNKNKYSVFLIGFGVIILSESVLGYVANNLIKNSLIIILPIFLISILYFTFVYKLKSFNRKL
jgi:lipopolysaccharide export LptBFGC system permease protein LptF